MRGLKRIIVISTAVATAALLGACQSYKDCGYNCGLKLGAAGVAVEQSAS